MIASVAMRFATAIASAKRDTADDMAFPVAGFDTATVAQPEVAVTGASGSGAVA